jgi:cell division protein FtsL
VRSFWVIIFLIGLVFSMGQVWKANEVSRLCTRLDSLRSRNQNLDEQVVALRLKFKEMSSYSRIEPLARDMLGMRPAQNPPVILTPVDDRFLAYKRRESQRDNE